MSVDETGRKRGEWCASVDPVPRLRISPIQVVGECSVKTDGDSNYVAMVNPLDNYSDCPTGNQDKILSECKHVSTPVEKQIVNALLT